MTESKVPRHIAVILDGNRRYAKRIGIPKFRGHEKGFEKIKDITGWCIDLGVKELTLYCFSTENFKRDKKEVEHLFKLFRKKIDEFKENKMINDKKVKVKVIGRIPMFPQDMQQKMKEVMEKTKDHENFTLNLALAYGGRGEIADAVKKMVSSGNEINEENISANLYLPHDVDLFIRPGGEKRLSNFLLWQTAYAEIIWTEKMWPEFTKEDLIRCVQEYEKRERRFGE